MPLETQASPIPVSPSKGVDVDKIEKELASMWAGASDSDNGESGAGVTCACALNLIVYTTPWVDREQLEELLSQFNEQHPRRTLILLGSRQMKGSLLEAYISMCCRKVPAI